jgi:putative ABC transport system substrate-binding protein
MQFTQLQRREFITAVTGAAVWPLVAEAQQSALPVVGYVTGGRLPEADVFAFREGLNESGYVEGQNVAIEYRSAQGRHDLLPTLVADLVRRQVRLIVTYGTPSTVAAKTATTTIPIIFEVGVDPVAFGLVTNFPRPEGNLTGFHVLSVAVSAKRLEFLRLLLPTIANIALITNPTSAFAEPERREMQHAAQTLGVQLQVLNAATETDIDNAFLTLIQQATGALVISADVPFIDWREKFVALAALHQVPTIYPYREYVLRGGLMSYGPSLSDINRKLGGYAGLVLKGKKPAELPVQQLVTVECIINLKTAKTLGVTMPLPLLGRANEVIE